MKKVFIGIDFSKLKFDAVLIIEVSTQKTVHQEFDNTPSGYQDFVLWISRHTNLPSQDWLICGEHTGLYSYCLTEYLNESSIDIWLENPVQIKRSMGLTRGKTDKADALNIALYAYRFRDKAQSTKLRDKALEQIKDLMAFRARLTDMKTALQIPANELAQVKTNESVFDIVSESLLFCHYIQNLIDTIEQRIKSLLSNHELLYQNYDLLLSVKGIGFVNAVMMLVITNNFNEFDNPRKFGCYCGVVPFCHQSGTSIRGKDRVSQMANKKMKALLTQAALAAVKHDPKFKSYYIRKLQEDKDHALIINNVRNKLIHIMFAVIKNKKPYDQNYINTNNNVA